MSIPVHPLLDELDAALAGLIPEESVDIRGKWSLTTRRTYATDVEEGSGSGVHVDIEDRHWRAALTCSAPIAGVAFLIRANSLSWAKSKPAALVQPLEISFHTYCDYLPNRATFAVSLGGASHSVPVTWRADLAETCLTLSPRLTTGRVTWVARTDEAEFAVFLLPGNHLKTGRNRLWHLRDEIASALPPRSRELLTRGRSGEFT